MVFVAYLSLAAILVITLTTLVNALSFPRLGRRPQPPIAPTDSAVSRQVSVLVPARNEAAVIGETLAALLRQDYPDFEVILLDDASSDGTGEIARLVGRGDARLRLLQGKPLPPGWTGKNWACWQLADQASGELLVFTDADVRWEPGALRRLAGWVESIRADALTVWPTQETRSFAERLVVPMMMFAITGYLPEIGVRWLPFPAFAAANGQCLAFRRDAYAACGGHAAVRGNIVEDVALARAIKRSGRRLVMVLGDGQITGRMYTNWRTVRHGFAKNILAGHADSPLFLGFSALFHWTVFMLPWAWLAAGLAGWIGLGAPLALPAATLALGIGARALSARMTRARVADALLLPVSVLLMTVIAGQALWWHYHDGGPQWKGRQIPSQTHLEQP